MSKIVLAFDFDGVIIDTAYESYLISARTYNEMTGKNAISEKNAAQYSKGRAFSLNAETNYTLIKMIDENSNLDFSTLSQSQFDAQVTQNKEIGKLFEEKFFQTRKKIEGTLEWFDMQKPFLGIIDSLTQLAKKYPLYIVTTKPRLTVIATLDYFNIKVPHEKVLSERVIHTKENLLKEVAEKENVLISQVVLIDDAIKQLIKAKEVGAKTILSMWGEKRKVFESEAKIQEIQIAYSPNDCKTIISSL
jgi:HAD superfamily hydrolase (TIGR01509 family)